MPVVRREPTLAGFLSTARSGCQPERGTADPPLPWGPAMPNQGESRRSRPGPRPGPPAHPKATLEALYVGQGKSTRVIAAELGYPGHHAVLRDLHAYGIPVRARTARGSSRRPPLTAAVLRDLYGERGWSTARIAEHTGVSVDAVRRSLRRHGTPRRPLAPGPEQALTRRRFEELHHRQGLTLGEIATLLGTHQKRVRRRVDELGLEVRKLHASPGATMPAGGEARLAELYGRREVIRALRRHRVPRRDAPGAAVHRIPLRRPLLEDLYGGCGLSSVEVGLLLGRTSASVMRALRVEGVEVRPPPPPRPPAPPRPPRPPAPPRTPLVREVLEDLYVAQNLTLAEVARRCGYRSPNPVRAALERHGIPVRRVTVRPRRVVLSRELLVELYANQGLTPKAIAELLGDYSATTVRNRLKRYGIPTRGPRYTKSTPMPELTEALLRQLYVEQRLRAREIAARLGYANAAVRRALRRHGIVIEDNRRGRPRQRRIEFDRALLEELYVNRDLSAEAVGRELGVTGALVLKRLHDYGIPVRRTRWDHPSDGPVRLEELKKNRMVRVALVKAGIPPWRETGAAAVESLGPELLHTLYEELGLSTFDIELVTGRTQTGVRADLARAGITLRPRPGYRGPKQAARTRSSADLAGRRRAPASP